MEASIEGEAVPAQTVADVSVVIAVYNTMPYLTRCLDSVLRQSIGADRLEIIAVDDGSTDGSGAELDTWAQRHPGTVTVVHQPNSGGPAAPSNRALEIATGRYVFFLGADDYLGREALERLVATADELDADIVLGRLVGAGGRGVSQAVYAQGNRDDITLADSALPWALSNTKLFRRSLIEDHRLRYLEHLRSYSDQPFTLRAVVAARRIAVRADYVFYHAVRRTDSSNITYRTSLERFLHDAAAVMDTAATVVTDPVARERVLHRNFSWEIAKLLTDRFLAADRDEQLRVQEGVRTLAEAYLSKKMRTGLEVHRRIAISVAQHGTLDDLLAVSRHYAEQGLAPVVRDGDRFYAALPGFRDPARGFPDEWYDASNAIRKLARQTGPADVRWEQDDDGRRVLVVRWHSAMPGLGENARVDAGGCPGRLTFTSAGPGTDVVAEFPVDDLVANARRRRRRRIRFTWTTLGRSYTEYLTGLDLTAAGRIVYRHGLRFFVLHVKYDRDFRLRVVINPVNARRIAGRVAHEWRYRRASYAPRSSRS
jgi:poly(ribitol-phosphate) beta-N-acetylglucosaminyltransferase